MAKWCQALSILGFTLGLLSAISVFAATADEATAQINRGKAVFLDREGGHCLLCHQVSQIDEPFQGSIGTDLSNVGARLSSSELYQRIADPTEQNPNTVMPGYFRTSGLTQVAQAYVDQPVLTADEMQDLVAFLLTLKLTEPPS